MRKDYAEYFLKFQSELKKSNFQLEIIFQSELTAFLQLKDGGVIIFDCERYYGPAFNVAIAHTVADANSGKDFALRLLMKIFERKRGRTYGPPTFENEAKFLALEKWALFNAPEFYAKDYQKLNAIQ